MKTRNILISASAAALLAACGGGGGDGIVVVTPEVTAVPASATASVSAWTQFVASLMNSETATPLTMEGIVAPTNETAEPQPLT